MSSSILDMPLTAAEAAVAVHGIEVQAHLAKNTHAKMPEKCVSSSKCSCSAVANARQPTTTELRADCQRV